MQFIDMIITIFIIIKFNNLLIIFTESILFY